MPFFCSYALKSEKKARRYDLYLEQNIFFERWIYSDFVIEQPALRYCPMRTHCLPKSLVAKIRAVESCKYMCRLNTEGKNFRDHITSGSSLTVGYWITVSVPKCSVHITFFASLICLRKELLFFLCNIMRCWLLSIFKFVEKCSRIVKPSANKIG